MKNKKSNVNFVKTFLSTLIVIMLIAATVAIGFFSTGFRNWTKEDWETVWNETFKEDPAPEDDGGSDPEIEESAISLNMSSSEGSVAVTATITPSTASNKKVDWSLAWKNASSSWANGKTVTDYVTVTPDSDGSLTATVKAINAFSEQIILTCTSRDDADVKSTCTIDYSKKIESISVSIKKDGSDSALYWSNDGDLYDIVVNTTLSEGTIEDNFTFSYSMEATDEFISACQQTYNGFNPSGASTQISLIGKTTFALKLPQIETSYEKLTSDYIYFHIDRSNSALYRSAVNKFKSAVESFNGSMFNLKISASNAYSNYEKTVGISSSGANFSVSVEDVTLSDSSIIF